MQSAVSSMRLRLPRIEVGALPHFYMTGSFDAKTGSVPSVGVSWYANGGYFDRAQIIGIGEGRYDEVALPLSPRVLSAIGRAISEHTGAGGGIEVTQNIENRIVRSNEDLYVAADILSRAAASSLGVV